MDRSQVPIDALAQSSSATATSVTTTLAAAAGKKIVVFGWSGSALAQTVIVELKFASTVKSSMQGVAGATVGMPVSGVGIAAAVNEAVTVVTTPAASALCKANVVYKYIAVEGG
jgi:hypothetical protein